MCRFLIYKGRKMSMSDLLEKADQSLIRQSFKARERKEPLNGDGFGIGWYAPDIDPEPCVFTSTTPAWSNRNLHRLAQKIYSGCFFAHVRAASPGIAVSQANCHPFQQGQFLWMHNGGIAGFRKIRRRLIQYLDDLHYDLIEGTTDSEHIFAVFLQLLRRTSHDDLIDAMQASLVELIGLLEDWTKEASVDGYSRYNFAATDGNTIIASRYITGKNAEPHSLYVAKGRSFGCVDGKYRMEQTERQPEAAIIASEPLTEDRSGWTPIPRNHLVLITPAIDIAFVPIKFQ